MQSNIVEPKGVNRAFYRNHGISEAQKVQMLEDLANGKTSVRQYPKPHKKQEQLPSDQNVSVTISPVVFVGRGGQVAISSSEVVREIVAEKAIGLDVVEVAPPTAPLTGAPTSVAKTAAATKDDLSTCDKVIVCLFFLLLCTLLMLLYVWWKNDMSIPNLSGRRSGRSRSDRCFDPFPEPLRPCVGEPNRAVPVNGRSTWTATIVGGVAIVAPFLAPFFFFA